MKLIMVSEAHLGILPKAFLLHDKFSDFESGVVQTPRGLKIFVLKSRFQIYI